MALETQCTHIGQIALAAAFDHWCDVIGIPESFAAAHSPLRDSFGASRTAQTIDVPELGNAIEAAERADAAIAFKDLIAQIARICSKPPFVHAPFGAERQPARGHFQIAPAAETSPVGTFRQIFANRAASRHGTAAREMRIL